MKIASTKTKWLGAALLFITGAGLGIWAEIMVAKNSAFHWVEVHVQGWATDTPKLYYSADGMFREHDAVEGRRYWQRANERRFRFPLPRREISHLRFDPTASHRWTLIEFLQLRSRTGDHSSLFDLPMVEGEEVEVVTRENGSWRIQPIAKAHDPHISFTLSEPIARVPWTANLHPLRGVLFAIIGGGSLAALGWWALTLAPGAIARLIFTPERLRTGGTILAFMAVAVALFNTSLVLPLLAGAGLLALANAALKGRILGCIKDIPMLWVVIGWFGFAALSSLWAVNAGFSYLELEKGGLSLMAFLVFGMVLQKNRDVSRAHLFFQLLGLLGIFFLLREIWSGMYFKRGTSFFPHANLFSYFWVLILPPALAFVLDGQRQMRGRVMQAVLLSAGLAALMISQSRGGILGFGVAAGVIFLVRFPRQTLIAGAILVIPAFFVVQRLLLSLGRSSVITDDHRSSLYATAWDIIREHPLGGTGVGNFVLEYIVRNDGEPHIHAHNLLLHFQAELGIGGTLFLLFFLAAIARQVIVFIRCRPLDMRLLGWHAALIGSLTCLMFDYQVSYLPLAVMTMLPLMIVLKGFPRAIFSPENSPEHTSKV